MDLTRENVGGRKIISVRRPVWTKKRIIRIKGKSLTGLSCRINDENVRVKDVEAVIAGGIVNEKSSVRRPREIGGFADGYLISGFHIDDKTAICISREIGDVLARRGSALPSRRLIICGNHHRFFHPEVLKINLPSVRIGNSFIALR